MSRILLIVLVICLEGCSYSPMPVAPQAPLYQVQAETWRAIDEQILDASIHARREAVTYARLVMDNWHRQVKQRTRDIFIPWYSNYWTQQWMATRVTWYKLQSTEDELTPENRLLNYLQQQFYEQVLEPIHLTIDPHTVMQETTAHYLQQMKKRLEQLPFEYNIPPAVLKQHLKFIPAITVSEEILQEASLYDVLQTSNFSALPAYKALLLQMAVSNSAVSSTSSTDGLDRVAREAVAKLVEQMTMRGGLTAASAIMGGYGGMLISVGAITWSAVQHANNKSVMEAQLRENLDVMLDVMWQGLVEDPRGGVTAVVLHISHQIEYAAFTLDPDGSGLF